MRQQSTDTPGAYTAQSVSPPGAPSPHSTSSDSASAGTPVTGRPGAWSPALPSPRPFHNTSPPYRGAQHRGRPGGGRGQDSPRGSPVSASADSGRTVPGNLTPTGRPGGVVRRAAS